MFEVKDSGQRQTFSSGMQRDTEENKIKWSLIASGPMLKRWAIHLTGGAKKYDDDNWMKASDIKEFERFRASAFRHFMQWYYGDRDEDHAAAVYFNINGGEYVREHLNESTTKPVSGIYSPESVCKNERGYGQKGNVAGDSAEVLRFLEG